MGPKNLDKIKIMEETTAKSYSCRMLDMYKKAALQVYKILRYNSPATTRLVKCKDTILAD